MPPTIMGISDTRREVAIPRAIICIALASIASCSRYEHNTVVLSRGEMLTEKPVEYRSSETMRIHGPLSSVCFALKDGVSMEQMETMNRIFADSIGSVQLGAALILSTGYRMVLSRPSLSWSDKGVILKDRELSACAAPPCGITLPVGATVSKIEAWSVPNFFVKGIYWTSEPDQAKPLLPSVAPKPAPQRPSISGCSPDRNAA